MELTCSIKRTDDSGVSFYYAVDNEEEMIPFRNPVVDHLPLSDREIASFLPVADQAYHAGWSQAEMDAIFGSLSREKADLFRTRIFERHRNLRAMIDMLHKLREERAYKSPTVDDKAFLELTRLETRGIEHRSWWNAMVRVVANCVSELKSKAELKPKELKCCCTLELS